MRCCGYEGGACEKNMDVKSMQVNTSKSVTRMTKTAVDILTDYIGIEFLDALSTCCGCSGWTKGHKIEQQRLF